jgi:hypothetical protein
MLINLTEQQFFLLSNALYHYKLKLDEKFEEYHTTKYADGITKVTKHAKDLGELVAHLIKEKDRIYEEQRSLPGIMCAVCGREFVGRACQDCLTPAGRKL